MRSIDAESDRPLRTLIHRLAAAPISIAILWPVFLMLGGYLLWRYWGVEHVGRRFENVAMENIEVTPPPPHIRSDIVDRVYEDTAMNGLSLMDPAAASKVAHAFSMHPWVRRVSSVRKLAGGKLDVRVQYRTPVAMARVYRAEYLDDERHFLPIDDEGVLLPSDDFPRSEIPNFLHIEIPGADSNSRPGSAFGDPRVEAAAQLAAFLAPHRENQAIERISTIPEDRFRSGRVRLVIYDRLEREIVWGSPPCEELPGEATASVKLQRLLSMKSREGASVQPATVRLD